VVANFLSDAPVVRQRDRGARLGSCTTPSRTNFKESAKELDWRANFIPGNGPILSRRNKLATI
jgi:hypothetical protein